MPLALRKTTERHAITFADHQIQDKERLRSRCSRRRYRAAFWGIFRACRVSLCVPTVVKASWLLREFARRSRAKRRPGVANCVVR